MNDTSHKQAIQLINRRTDGLLKESQLLALDEHLHSCDSCRAYATSIDGLSAHLQNEFHRRWDENPGPSQQVFEHVTTRASKIAMANRLSSGVKLLAGAMALLVLAIGINFVVSRLQSTSPVTNATETVNNTSLANERLLAFFTSDQNENSDIYTMRADGSGLTNLTNHPARDLHPIWSPDGNYIAFESDRDGFMQIYRMDADGSNVVQLTRDDADHKLTLQYDGKYNPWSPDGNRLIFIQEESGGEAGTLYSIDINGENEVRLANGRISPNHVSWSPDGKYIGYVLNISSTPDEYVADIHVVEPDGSNIRELKNLLPAGGQLNFFSPYYWSSNGQSIVFPALMSNPSRQPIYELDLQTNTFLSEMGTKPIVEDWGTEVSLIIDINQEGNPFVWERSDGTGNTFEASKAWGESCNLDFTRSPQNNFAFGLYCPDNKFDLYWTNADGSTIKQLMTWPIDVHTGNVGDIAWSPDDQYMAFYLTTADKTDMYIVKVEEMLVSPSLQPLKISVNNETYSTLSWRPLLNDQVVEENPTPAPTQDLASDGLLAFTSDQNGNSDIYTIHADGSGLTNITNYMTHDSNPFWSPDGKRIAFERDQDGFTQIYLMDADGSNVIQLTQDETHHSLPLNIDGRTNPWSPDGSKILFLQSNPGGETWLLNSIDTSGENRISLGTGRFSFNGISWSPDGEYIGYTLNASTDPDDFVSDPYIIDANGRNLRQLKNFAPHNDHFNISHQWSSDGHSVTFTTTQKDDSLQTVYEFDPETNTLRRKDTVKAEVLDWGDEAYFGIDVEKGELSFFWQRPDGTSNTLDWEISCSTLNFRRSHSGNFAIGAHCPDHESKFYWANADGSTIKPLLNSSSGLEFGRFEDIAWSTHDQYIAFTITTDKTSMYILNVEQSLTNPSMQPVQVLLSNDELYTIPSWQPVANLEIVHAPTPEPEPTQIVEPEPSLPIGTGIENGEWIAFIGGEAVPDPIPVNQDVYLIHPDGSGLVNLTQSPAHYYYLQWSPNGQHLIFIRNTTDNKTDIMSHHVGETSPEVLASTVFNPVEYNPNQYFEYSWSPDSKQIAFLDKRAGNYDIYAIDADGSNEPELRQLTNDPGQEIDFAWSPDGSQIAYQRTTGEQLSIMVMNADGSNQHEVARGMGEVRLRWSMDGKSLYVTSVYLWADVKNSHLECEACVAKPAIYRIDLDDQSVQQIYYEEDPSKVDGWYLYDTPQNTLYFMRSKPQAFVGSWGTWFRTNGDSVEEIGELDPHQTCKTTTGNILNEHISPNNRFSIISNFCAGGFDLYLADREAPNPKQKLVHLLRLPLNTWGQGGDNATLPMLWSPDGRWLVYDDGNQSVYLLDIEQILRDPTTEPVILFQSDSNLFMLSELAWQPKP